MRRPLPIRQVLACAAVAAASAVFTAPPAAASGCVHAGATADACVVVYFEEGHNCVTTWGQVAGQRYATNPCR